MSEFLADEDKVSGVEEIVVADVTIPLERACTYKTVEATKLVGKLLAAIDIKSLTPELAAVVQQGGDVISLGFLAQKLIPMVADEAPDVLMSLAALMIVPNSELKELYGKANKIKNAIEAKRKFLLFDALPEDSVNIVVAFFPYMGLGELKNALGPLVEKLSGLIPKAEEEATS